MHDHVELFCAFCCYWSVFVIELMNIFVAFSANDPCFLDFRLFCSSIYHVSWIHHEHPEWWMSCLWFLFFPVLHFPNKVTPNRHKRVRVSVICISFHKRAAWVRLVVAFFILCCVIQNNEGCALCLPFFMPLNAHLSAYAPRWSGCLFIPCWF